MKIVKGLGRAAWLLVQAGVLWLRGKRKVKIR